MPRGGAREGAGRKALHPGEGKVKKTIELEERYWDMIDRAAEREGVSRNAFFRLVAQAWEDADSV